MMRDYWRRRREIEDSLPPGDSFFITSTEVSAARGGRAGVVAPVDRKLAAQFIHDGTFRLSTDEEIEVYKLESERTRKAHEAAELTRKGVVRISIPGMPLATKSSKK